MVFNILICLKSIFYIFLLKGLQSHHLGIETGPDNLILLRHTALAIALLLKKLPYNHITNTALPHIHRHRQLIEVLCSRFFQVNAQPQGEFVDHIQIEKGVVELVKFSAGEFRAVLLQQVKFCG